MNERQWELYRLSVVEQWSEIALQEGSIGAIEHKLMVLDQDAIAREADNRHVSAVNSRTRRAVA